MKRLLTIAMLISGLIFGVMGKDREKMRVLPGAPDSGVSMKFSEESQLSSPNYIGKIMRSTSKDLLSASSTKRGMKRSSGEGTANTVKVTFRFPALGEDTDWTMPLGVVKVYNGEGYYEEIDISPYDEEGNPITITEWECELPVGTVDVLSIFALRNVEQLWQTDPEVIYIAENIKIEESLVIDLRPEESTICLGMYPSIPNGEKVRLRKVDFAEDWSWEIIEEGNVTDDILDKFIFYKGQNVEYIYTNVGGTEVVPGAHGKHNPYGKMNFYVNQVSDNYTFRVIHTMPAWPDETEGIYVAVTETKGSKAGVYINSDYTLDHQTILHTPAYEKYPPTVIWDEPVYPYEVTIWPYGSPFGDVIRSKVKDVWKVWNSGPSNPVDSSNDRYYSIRRKLSDIQIVDEYENPVVYSIDGTNLYPFGVGGYTYCQFGIGYLNLLETGYQPDAVIPGNPEFLSLLENTEVVAGGTAPLLTSYIYSGFDWIASQTVNYIDGYFRGRLGESINSDMPLSMVTMKVDDKNVASGLASVQNWMIEHQDVKGKYEIAISTDNFEIEGIKGGNSANVTFDTSKADKLPPTVTFMQTRRNGKILTQNFDTAKDAEVFLTAADLTICYSEQDEDGWQYSYCNFSTPAKVSAMVKPTGVVSDAYNEIELKEEPDKFLSPGFGAFYRGSLASVNQTSPTGWFDLTLTVEDEAGNRQVQTLSPAFKIESLTADVSTPMVQDREVYVQDGRIVMPEGSRVYTIDGRQVSAEAAVKGMYIVVTPRQGYRVVL